jgi:hypothetical protein
MSQARELETGDDTMTSDTTTLLSLIDLPGFDPEGLRVWHSNGTVIGVAVDHVVGSHVLTACAMYRMDFALAYVSLADPRTEDALWRWARERMGWPKSAWWEWHVPEAPLVVRLFSVAVRGLEWTAWSAPGYGGVHLLALADATSDLHALAIVLRWIGQQPATCPHATLQKVS